MQRPLNWAGVRASKTSDRTAATCPGALATTAASPASVRTALV